MPRKTCSPIHWASFIMILLTVTLSSGVTGKFHHVDERDVCHSAPCQNGGECIDLTNAAGEKRFQCACLEGFEGLTCQKRINPCSSYPCENEGQCVPRPGGSYQCICTKGFFGHRCEKTTVADPCEKKPCSPNGACIPNNEEYVCECQSGFSGPKCMQKTPPEDEPEKEVVVTPNTATTDPRFSALVIALLATVATLIVILLLVGIHCARVITRLSNFKAAQERRKTLGEEPGECPGFVDTSNAMCVDFFCCRDRKRYMGEVTGVIVPVDEYKTMMKMGCVGDDRRKSNNQDNYSNRKVNSTPNVNSGSNRNIINEHQDHPPAEDDSKVERRHSKHSSVAREENYSPLKPQLNIGDQKHSYDPKMSEHSISANQPQRPNPMCSPSRFSSPSQIAALPSYYENNDNALNYSPRKNDPQISFPITNSGLFDETLRYANSAPKLNETPLIPYQYESISHPTLVPKSHPLQAADLSQHQLVNQKQLHERMSNLLQRQSQLSQTAQKLSKKYSPSQENYFNDMNMHYTQSQVDNGMPYVTHQHDTLAQSLKPGTPRNLSAVIQQNLEHPSGIALNRYPSKTINDNPRPSRYTRSELKNYFELPPSLTRVNSKAHSGSSRASMQRKKSQQRNSNLNYSHSDDNESLEEMYFNNNSELDDGSIENISPTEYLTEADEQRQNNGWWSRAKSNSISQTVKKQRKQLKQVLSEDDPYPFFNKSRRNDIKLKSQEHGKRINLGQNPPRPSGRGKKKVVDSNVLGKPRELNPHYDSTAQNNSAKKFTHKRQKAKYTLLPQNTDSDEYFDEDEDLLDYHVMDAHELNNYRAKQYNQHEKNNEGDEVSDDEEEINIVNRERNTMDDGYVSTGRMSESDVGGRDGDPMTFEQRLPNQKKQVYRIRPRINGEDTSIRGREPHPSLSPNTTDDEGQDAGLVYRKPRQRHQLMTPKRIVRAINSNEIVRRQDIIPQQNLILAAKSKVGNSGVVKKVNGYTEFPVTERKKMKRGEIPGAYKKSASRIRLKRKEGQILKDAVPSSPRLKGILKKKSNI